MTTKKIMRGVAAAMLTASICGGGMAQAQPDLQGSIQFGQTLRGSLQNLPTGAPKRTFTVGGVARTAIVHVPANAAGRKLPVVFMFGGWQHSAERTQSYSQLEATAPDAIIVYPQGIADAWEGAPYAETSRGQDVAFVRAITQSLVQEGSADQNRIYATGLSNGGGMAMALACQAPDLVKAVVSVSGAHYNPTITGCATGRVPSFIVHGTDDDISTYDGGERHGAPYFSAPEVLRNASTRNGCAVGVAPVTSRYEPGVDKIAYSGCAAATALLRVNGGGHTWYPASPSAAALAWGFFSRH